MTVLIAVVAVLNLALGYWLAIYLGDASIPTFVPFDESPAPALEVASAPAPVAEKQAPTEPEVPAASSPPADPPPTQPAPTEQSAAAEAAEAAEDVAAAEPEEEASDDSDDETDLLAGIESFRAQLAQQKPDVEEADDGSSQPRTPTEEEPLEGRVPGSAPADDLSANDTDTAEQLDSEDDEDEDNEETGQQGDAADDEVAAGIAAFREQLAVMKNAGLGSPATVKS